MRGLITLLAVLQCLLLLVGFVADNAVNAPTAEYAGQAVTAGVPDALITGQELRQRGEVEVIATGARVHIRELRPLLPSAGASRWFTRSWDLDGVEDATGTAPGLDGETHFINSFLLGFKPYDMRTVWGPLSVLATQKIYELDEVQHRGRTETWQNAEQFWVNQRGDCEDHAILLADWMRSLGYEASVAGGTYRGGGHAWVVLKHNGREYILEATDKVARRNVSGFLRVERATDYVANVMFDGRDYWVSDVRGWQRSYFNGRWTRKSRFYHAP